MKRLALVLGTTLLFFAASHDLGARSVDKGRAIYDNHCAACHGEHGEVSRHGKSLKPFPAKDLRTNILSDKELRYIIKYGIYGRAMQGQEKNLSDDEINDVMAYIRTLKYTPDLKHGKKRFKAVCAPCHVDPKGRNLSKAKDLAESRLTKEEMAEVIRYGRHERPMLARRDSLSNVDIADILSYLLSIRK